MGWETDYFPKPEPGDHFSARGDIFRYGLTEKYYVDGEGDMIIKVGDWSPVTKVDHLMMCLNALNEKNYLIKMGNESGEFHDEWWCKINSSIIAHNINLHFAILDAICKLFKIKR